MFSLDMFTLRTRVIAVFILVFLLSFAFWQFVARAQTQPTDPVAAREAQLQAELNQVLKDIDVQQQILQQEQQKAQTLQGDITILNAKIAEAKLKIKARQLAIEALGKNINQKTDAINKLTGKIDDTHDSLAQLIRKTNEMDDFTITDVILSDKNISEFFADVDAYDSIKESIQVALGYIKKTKQDTEVARQTLDHQRLEEIDAKISIETEKANIEQSEKQKAQLLSLSKEQQRNYQTIIKQKQARAATIRSALFALRDTGAIPFGKALEFATEASKATGIRPAFLLAILSQESDLGKNIGTCNRAGDPPEKGWRVIMKPSRDQAPYLRLTTALGLNPDTMPLSCPMNTGGYGGAMGPSQFIPSTWELFQPRIAQALNVTTPNPWEPEHAFMASALYLNDLGAGSQSYSDERNAACRYYSGRSCDSRRPANSFYGNSVMQKAASIQTNMIDPLSGV